MDTRPNKTRESPRQLPPHDLAPGRGAPWRRREGDQRHAGRTAAGAAAAAQLRAVRDAGRVCGLELPPRRAGWRRAPRRKAAAHLDVPRRSDRPLACA